MLFKIATIFPEAPLSLPIFAVPTPESFHSNHLPLPFLMIPGVFVMEKGASKETVYVGAMWELCM